MKFTDKAIFVKQNFTTAGISIGVQPVFSYEKHALSMITVRLMINVAKNI